MATADWGSARVQGQEHAGDDRAEAAELVAALREYNRRLVELEELARVGSWEWDVAADSVTWSDEMYRMFGVKEDAFDATFDAYLECLHPDDRARARTSVELCLGNGS